MIISIKSSIIREKPITPDKTIENPRDEYKYRENNKELEGNQGKSRERDYVMLNTFMNCYQYCIIYTIYV